MNSTVKTETASDGTVTVTARRGDAWVQHFSAHRGGALFLGQIELRDLATGRRARISSTSIATDSEAHLAYLFDLWAKHLGAPTWWTDLGLPAADFAGYTAQAAADRRECARRLNLYGA